MVYNASDFINEESFKKVSNEVVKALNEIKNALNDFATISNKVTNKDIFDFNVYKIKELQKELASLDSTITSQRKRINELSNEIINLSKANLQYANSVKQVSAVNNQLLNDLSKIEQTFKNIQDIGFSETNLKNLLEFQKQVDVLNKSLSVSNELFESKVKAGVSTPLREQQAQTSEKKEQQTSFDPTSIKGLREELKNLKNTFDELNAAERENIDIGIQIQSMIKEIESTLKPTKIAIEPEIIDPTSIKGLKKELKDLEEAFNNLSEAQRENADVGEKMKNRINEIKETLNPKKVDETKQAFEELKNTLNNLGDSNLDEFKRKIESVGSERKTIDQLKQTLSELSKIRTTFDFKTNPQAFKALSDEIDKVNNELKELDSQVGNSQRNVGNYADSIREVFGEILQSNAGGFQGIGSIQDTLFAKAQAFASANPYVTAA